MARTRAMLLTAIWQDEEFTALAARVQWLYLFLLSQPDVNHLGVLPLLPVRWAQAAPGESEQTIMYDLEALAEARFVVVDRVNGAVLIRTFMRHDGVIKQPNVLRAARSAVAALLSPAVAQALVDELVTIDTAGLPASVEPIINDMKDQLKLVAAKGTRNPSGKGSPKGSEKGSAKGTGEGSPNPLGDRGKGLGVTEDVAVRASAHTRARGTRLPEDFTVTPEMVAWFHERCPGLDGKTETEKFRNYWRAKTGQAATKLDWPATWRNWMLSAWERLPSRPAGGQSRSTTDERVASALTLGEDLQARLDRGELGQ